MPPIGSNDPRNGAQTRGHIRSNQQLALPKIDPDKIPTEEQLILLHTRQGTDQLNICSREQGYYSP